MTDNKKKETFGVEELMQLSWESLRVEVTARFLKE